MGRSAFSARIACRRRCGGQPGLGQGVLLTVQQLAGGADPGVADQRAGTDDWLGGQKAAGGFGGIGIGRGRTPTATRPAVNTRRETAWPHPPSRPPQPGHESRPLRRSSSATAVLLPTVSNGASKHLTALPALREKATGRADPKPTRSRCRRTPLHRNQNHHEKHAHQQRRNHANDAHAEWRLTPEPTPPSTPAITPSIPPAGIEGPLSAHSVTVPGSIDLQHDQRRARTERPAARASIWHRGSQSMIAWKIHGQLAPDDDARRGVCRGNRHCRHG